LSTAKTKLLAVDLDGTLVDSAPDIAHSLGVALEAVGLDAPGEARTRTWIGDGIETVIARALAAADAEHAGRGAPPDARAAAERQAAVLAAFAECYRNNLFVRTEIYPAVETTLDALRARGIRLCCVTNKRYVFSEALLQQAGLWDRFELVLGGDSLPEKKPSPLPLNVAAEKLGVDSPQDLRAARAASFGFVFAAYGYGKVDPKELGSSPRIERFAEIESLIA
jgi:phosphoglycolate phosphatase